MELLTANLPYNHRVYFISDFHEGTILQDVSGLETTIQRIKHDPLARVVVGGDLAEAIMIDDPRYSSETMDKGKDIPILQYRSVIERLRPISGKILCIMAGNHDWKIVNRVGNLVRDYVCHELNVPYGTYSVKITIKDPKDRPMYKLFYTHGNGTLNSTAPDPVTRLANMRGMLKRKLQHKFADCVLMGTAHNHKLVTLKPIPVLYLTTTEDKIQQHYTGSEQYAEYIHPDHRFYFSSGSFLKLFARGVSGYGELAGFDPHELGYCIAHAEDGILKNVTREILHMEGGG